MIANSIVVNAITDIIVDSIGNPLIKYKTPASITIAKDIAANATMLCIDIELHLLIIINEAASDSINMPNAPAADKRDSYGKVLSKYKAAAIKPIATVITIRLPIDLLAY